MPSSVYKIMSETKRKVAAGRSHASCGSAPRNYGSCHGCSFVDGVFAPRGGCPNHEPRKLHPLPIPFPYFAYPSSHEAPRTTPSLLSVFHPLPSPPTFPFPTHPTFSPTPYILISSRIYWCPCAVVSRWFIENWKTDNCQSSPLPPRRNHKTCDSILLHSKFSLLQPVYYQRCIAYILNKYKIELYNWFSQLSSLKNILKQITRVIECVKNYWYIIMAKYMKY